MTPEDFKKKINSLFRGNGGKITDKQVAEHLGVSIQDVKRFKKGKLPPKYRREEIIKKLKRTWIHYEGYEADLELRHE